MKIRLVVGSDEVEKDFPEGGTLVWAKNRRWLPVRIQQYLPIDRIDTGEWVDVEVIHEGVT